MLTVLTVDSIEDNTTLDGWITIREAIGAANSDGPVGDAPAGSGADTIQFDPSLAGKPPIQLEGNQLVVAEDLTITGLGAGNLTIDAADLSRHLEVNPGVTLTISGLTLKDGNAGEGTDGGAIYSGGSLDLSDVLFERIISWR